MKTTGKKVKNLGDYHLEISPSLIPFSGHSYEMIVSMKNSTQVQKFNISFKMMEKIVQASDETRPETLLSPIMMSYRSTTLLEYGSINENEAT